MKAVYLLEHIYYLNWPEEEGKLIGIYSSALIAKQVIKEYQLLPGFQDYPNDFHLIQYILDQDYWKMGFSETENTCNEKDAKNCSVEQIEAYDTGEELDLEDYVFILQHSYEKWDLDYEWNLEYAKNIGIYSSKRKAEQAQRKFRLIKGFRSYLNGFYIGKHQINKNNWTDGFITIKYQ